MAYKGLPKSDGRAARYSPIQIRIDRARLVDYNHGVVIAITSAASKVAGERAVRYAREELARTGRNDTGDLSRSIKSRLQVTPAGVTWEIYSELPYAEFVERGTGEHGPYGTRITPITAPVLRFMPARRNSGAIGVGRNRKTGRFDNTVVYSAYVQGQQPTYFMSKAAKRIKITDYL